MSSYITSYNGLFTAGSSGAPLVKRIEIPIIQRDYAQGRESNAVARIRASFLDALHEAVTTGKAISLDFVYGDVVDGTLRPLDGQQRLTTLFLLHWYLGWRADRLDQEQGWKRFEYATRASARLFCGYLVESTPPFGADLRAWLEDQSWFLHNWEHDPSIQSMLVMLEAIHLRFAGANYLAAWTRLVDPEDPAISFHLLPIEKMGLSEDLYIKMNSRGKPLTPFENFKARFEQLLEQSCPNRVGEFAQKVDGAWADVLWPLRGSDNIADDEFLHYFRFVTEICDRIEGRYPSADVDALAERVYGPNNKNASAHLDFLIRCFDTWVGIDTAAEFSKMFVQGPSANIPGKVVLFGAPGNLIDLFAACCKGQIRFGWAGTLLLYAVILHRLYGTEDFPHRLRVLRNLIEASSNELRAERMPALLADVRRFVTEGAVDGITSFNQAQVSDEKEKADFLRQSPTLEQLLFYLEDHVLLRGCLSAFELDASVFERRAMAFYDLFKDHGVMPSLTGALLAAGDYSQTFSNRFIQLGSGSSFSLWREEILTGASRVNLTRVRIALGRLLDTLAERDGDVSSALESFADQWLGSAHHANGLDWRWYFVRYPEMRSGPSGIYASATGNLGYSTCMLDKKVMSSYYRDPFLFAIGKRSGVGNAAVVGAVAPTWSEGPWFTGYETEARWMRLTTSGTEIRCVQEGLQLRAPAAPHLDEFNRICELHGIGSDLCLRVGQAAVSGGLLDTEDRVQLGAALLRVLVGAGL